MSRGVTERLVEVGRGVRADTLPEEVREVARQCVLDWMGCALAGSAEPLTDILRREVAASDRGDEASLVGPGGRVTALTAALVNGAASHALDFDDTHEVMFGHPSVPVLPALCALAERDGRSGADLLAALVAGIEVECRLGALIGGPHYRAGWHSTATFGTFGAAAACAHLLGLDAGQWAHAMGLAGTQAAGLKSSFGSMAKPLHAGKAAANGLLAALLARGGFTANPETVEVAQGVAATMAGVPEPDARRLDAWDGRWMTRDTLFKYHAACYLTHAPINATDELRRVLGSAVPDEVDSVEVRVDPGALNVCNIPEPRTGLEGKFSLRATAAMSLLGHDMADLATYSDATVTAAPVVALRDRVEVVGDPEVAPMRAQVALRLRDGARHTVSADASVPAADLERQRAALERKFAGLARGVLGEARTAALRDALRRVEEATDVGELMRLASS